MVVQNGPPPRGGEQCPAPPLATQLRAGPPPHTLSQKASPVARSTAATTHHPLLEELSLENLCFHPFPSERFLDRSVARGPTIRFWDTEQRKAIRSQLLNKVTSTSSTVKGASFVLTGTRGNGKSYNLAKFVAEARSQGHLVVYVNTCEHLMRDLNRHRDELVFALRANREAICKRITVDRATVDDLLLKHCSTQLGEVAEDDLARRAVNILFDHFIHEVSTLPPISLHDGIWWYIASAERFAAVCEQLNLKMVTVYDQENRLYAIKQ